MKILTFDVEDWFHILNHASVADEKIWHTFPNRLDANMERIFTLLENNNCKATFFALGWVAREYPHILKRINEMGFEIASHSDLHKLAYQQSRKQFSEDIYSSIHSIQEVTGKKVRAYRAPGFSLREDNKWVFEILIENGIEIDCSVFPAFRSHGGFRNFGEVKPCFVDVSGVRIKEFPINVLYFLNMRIIYSGGGYFRFFRYRVINKWLKESEYVMTYFHPRDFDMEQPMIDTLGPLRKFKSYYGLKGSYAKLEKMIEDHTFIDLDTAVNQMDWTEAPIKYL